MTTIAFDGKMLAADGRATSYGMVCSDAIRKINFPPSGKTWVLCGVEIVAFGIAGEFCWSKHLLDLLNADDTGCLQKPTLPMPKEASFELLAITATGQPYLGCKAEDGELFSMTEISTPAAVGTGSYLAIGAMLAGKPAIDAVRIAMMRDPDTGGELSTFALHDIKS